MFTLHFSSSQEAVLVYLRGNLHGKGLMCGTEVRKKSVVGGIAGVWIHLLPAGGGALHALEMQTDVVVGGIRIRARLRMVVAPQFPPCIHHRARGITGRTGILPVHWDNGRLTRCRKQIPLVGRARRARRPKAE